MAQDIRRLVNLAYPSAPGDIKETLAKEQFIDSLSNSEMRLRIKQARPLNLNDAVRHAVELEAFNRAERKHLESQGYYRTLNYNESNESTKQNSVIESLVKSVNELKNKFDAFQRDNSKKLYGSQDRKSDFRRQTNLFKRRGSARTYSNNTRNKTNNFKCFNCGKEGHSQYTCTYRNKNSSSAASGQDPKHNINLSSKQTFTSSKLGSGLFVRASINGKEVNCLVDTGATLTMISTKFFETLGLNSNLEIFTPEIITASGTPLNTKGKTEINIEINGCKCQANVVVSDIDIDVVLGLDFMKAHNISVNVAENSMLLQGKICQLNCWGNIGCFRICVKDKSVIPSRSEALIQGKVSNSELVQKEGLYIVKPIENQHTYGKSLVAKSLVQGNSTIPLRIMNLSTEDQILHPGTNLAVLSPVMSVSSTLNKEKGSSKFLNI